MGNTPSSGFRTGTTIKPGFGLTTTSATSYRSPAHRATFGDVIPANNNNVPDNKQFGFFSSTPRPRYSKDEGFGGHSVTTIKAEGVTIDQPFKDGLQSNSPDKLKDDPDYKHFMEEWKNMVPQLEVGEDEPEDESGNVDDHTPGGVSGKSTASASMATKTTNTAVETISPTSGSTAIPATMKASTEQAPTSKPAFPYVSEGNAPKAENSSSLTDYARPTSKPESGLGLSQFAFRNSQKTNTSKYGYSQGNVASQQQGYTSSAYSRGNNYSSPTQNYGSKFSSSASSMAGTMSTPFARFIHTSTSNIAMSASKSNLSKLRKKTGYPFGNCKKALEENNNDLEKAEKWLEDQAKELGWSKAMKMDRNTPQGLIGIAFDDHYAAMVEMNCETDFVAKNEKFQKLVDLVAKTCLHHNRAENPSPKSISKVLLEGGEIGRLSVPGDQESIADQVARTIGLIGEKLVVRRAAFFSVAAPTLLAALTHPVSPNSDSGASASLMGRYGAVLAYSATTPDNSSAQLAKQLCQHVIGMNPAKIEASPDDPPPPPPPTPVVEEKPQAEESAEGDEEEQFTSKADEDEAIMMRQSFLLDPERSVADVVAEGGISVLDFVRFECGESLGEQEVTTTKVAQAGG